MKKLVPLIGAIALLAAAFAATPASAAGVTQCKTKVYTGQSPIYVTSTRGLTCASAAAEQRRYTWTGKNTFRTPGGYSCKPSGRGKVGYQIRCVKGARAYRIEFND